MKIYHTTYNLKAPILDFDLVPGAAPLLLAAEDADDHGA